MGEKGEMTLYDDFRVEGIELADPGINDLGGKAWATKREDGDNPLFPGGIKRPYGSRVCRAPGAWTICRRKALGWPRPTPTTGSSRAALRSRRACG